MRAEFGRRVRKRGKFIGIVAAHCIFVCPGLLKVKYHAISKEFKWKLSTSHWNFFCFCVDILQWITRLGKTTFTAVIGSIVHWHKFFLYMSCSHSYASLYQHFVKNVWTKCWKSHFYINPHTGFSLRVWAVHSSYWQYFSWKFSQQAKQLNNKKF